MIHPYLRLQPRFTSSRCPFYLAAIQPGESRVVALSVTSEFRYWGPWQPCRQTTLLSSTTNAYKMLEGDNMKTASRLGVVRASRQHFWAPCGLRLWGKEQAMGSGGHSEEESSREARKTKRENHKKSKGLLRKLWMSRERSWSVTKANGSI